MNRVLQPHPLIVLGLNVWMGTAAGADELVAQHRPTPSSMSSPSYTVTFSAASRQALAIEVFSPVAADESSANPP